MAQSVVIWTVVLDIKRHLVCLFVFPTTDTMTDLFALLLMIFGLSSLIVFWNWILHDHPRIDLHHHIWIHHPGREGQRQNRRPQQYKRPVQETQPPGDE